MLIPDNARIAPAAIREYICRCHDDEQLVTWWQRDNPRDPHEALWVITYNGHMKRFTIVSFPMQVSHWSHQVYGSSYGLDDMRWELAAGLWEAPEASHLALRDFLQTLS